MSKMPTEEEQFNGPQYDPDNEAFDPEAAIIHGLMLTALGVELSDHQEQVMAFGATVVIANQLLAAGMSQHEVLKRMSDDPPSFNLQYDSDDGLRINATWEDENGNPRPGSTIKVIEDEDGNRDMEVQLEGPTVRFAVPARGSEDPDD